jgi:osmotically-inducible protein OsmY
VNLTIITLAAAGALVAAPVSAMTTPAQSYKTTSPAPKTTQVKPVDDATLNDRIDARLKADATLKKFDVDASVKDGVATLTGKVRTEAEKVRAGRDAHVAGVTRVDNQLVLDKDAGIPVTDKVKSATDTTAKKTEQGLSKTGEVITDGWITTKIHGRFVGEDLLKGSDINVDTSNHVVTLKGTVKSDAARTRATEIARTTDGVNKVVDQLVVK